jgi:DNA-binding winged helix-turn-helix (wHTH) protein
MTARFHGLRSGSGGKDVFSLECGFKQVSVRSAMRLTFESCVLDLDTREVSCGGRAISLSPKAFALLELLVLRRPKALAKAEIHGALWPDTFVSETNLANLVVEVRAALGDDARAARIVRTVSRFGYAFCAEARVEGRGAPRAASAVNLAHRLVWGRRIIALETGVNLLGRDPDAVAWINHESVSRHHAHIVVDGTGATLEDLGSKNGTLVGGAPVTQPVRLGDGDEITLGEVPLRFHSFRPEMSTRTGRRKSGTTDEGD